MSYKCINCKWEGDISELTKVPPAPLAGKCPNCGDEVEETKVTLKMHVDVVSEPITVKESPVVKDELDIDGDGDVDEEDVSLAAKVLSKVGRKKKTRKRKKR